VEGDGIVLELPETAVAVEAEQSPDLARRMIVIDVLRRSYLADGTHAVL
jgi:hypothetical protein